MLPHLKTCYHWMFVDCVLLVMSGWGLDVFTKPSYYWWIVPVITTHIGAILGAWIYYLAIGGQSSHIPVHISMFRDQLAASGELRAGEWSGHGTDEGGAPSSSLQLEGRGEAEDWHPQQGHSQEMRWSYTQLVLDPWC